MSHLTQSHLNALYRGLRSQPTEYRNEKPVFSIPAHPSIPLRHLEKIQRFLDHSDLLSPEDDEN